MGGQRLATSHIENVLDDSKKKANETTLLYAAAKRLMEETANQDGQAISYMFDTENERLTNWAKTVGQDVFDWDSSYPDEGNKDRTVFVKNFESQASSNKAE